MPQGLKQSFRQLRICRGQSPRRKHTKCAKTNPFCVSEIATSFPALRHKTPRNDSIVKSYHCERRHYAEASQSPAIQFGSSVRYRCRKLRLRPNHTKCAKTNPFCGTNKNAKSLWNNFMHPNQLYQNRIEQCHYKPVFFAYLCDS